MDGSFRFRFVPLEGCDTDSSDGQKSASRDDFLPRGLQWPWPDSIELTLRGDNPTASDDSVQSIDLSCSVLGTVI